MSLPAPNDTTLPVRDIAHRTGGIMRAHTAFTWPASRVLFVCDSGHSDLAGVRWSATSILRACYNAHPASVVCPRRGHYSEDLTSKRSFSVPALSSSTSVISSSPHAKVGCAPSKFILAVFQSVVHSPSFLVPACPSAGWRGTWKMTEDCLAACTKRDHLQTATARQAEERCSEEERKSHS